MVNEIAQRGRHGEKTARLAQSVEHETLNLRVVGSSPTLGDLFFLLSMHFYDKVIIYFQQSVNLNFDNFFSVSV